MFIKNNFQHRAYFTLHRVKVFTCSPLYRDKIFVSFLECLFDCIRADPPGTDPGCINATFPQKVAFKNHCKNVIFGTDPAYWTAYRGYFTF